MVREGNPAGADSLQVFVSSPPIQHAYTERVRPPSTRMF